MRAAAVALVAVAAWFSTTPSREPRLTRVLGGTAKPRRDRGGFGPRLAGMSAAVSALVLVGGPIGIAMAIACLVVAPRLLGLLEARGVRSRREHLARQAPSVADLLAATLESGSPMRSALSAVADAIGGPASDSIRPVVAAMELGADPSSAWQPLAGDESLGAIATAVVRAERSGAPLANQLARIADDLRRQRQAAVESAARSAGVSAVGPLAACFLPAFLVLGVVPVVAGLASGLVG